MRFVCDSCRAQYMISDEKVGAKGVKVRCKKCGFVILVKRPDAGISITAAKPAAPVRDDEGQATQVMPNPFEGPSTTLPETAGATDPGPGPEGAAEASKPSEPQASGEPKSSKPLTGVDEDEIGAVFDQVLNSGAHKLPETESKPARAQVSLGGDDDDRMSTRVLDADTVKKLAAESEAQEKPREEEKEAPKADAPHDWFVAIDEKQTGPLTVEKLKDYWSRGEIGPDSLCWRSGFGDWMALSEVAELAAVLAPRPAKPVIVASAPAGAMASVVSVPVESAFSAGGMTKTVRSEVQVPLAAAPVEETSGWRPSAASALASLAKADIEALTKPKSKPAPEPSGALEDFLDRPSAPSKSLLDFPATEERTHGNGKANGTAHAKERERPVVHDEPVAEPRGRPMPNPYQAPGATYTSPGFSTYKPQSRKGLFIGLGVGAGIVVLSLITAIVYFATRQPVYPPPYYGQPGPNGQLPPGAVAANDAQVPPVRVVPANNAVAPANPPAAAAAPPAPVDPNPPAAATPPPAAATNDPPPAANPGPGRPKATRVASAGKTGGNDPSPKSAAPAEPPPKNVPEPSGDDFDKEFGHSSSRPEPKPKSDSSKTAAKSVYIPPAPGAVDLPASLGQSDIMQVVLSNKAGLARCAEEQKKKEPGVTGKLVMHWVIQTSGKTSNVSCSSDEFKGTYMASCLSGLIKGWSFPRHKMSQGQPVDFPFKF